MAINAYLVGDKQVINALRLVPDRLHKALVTALMRSAIAVETKTKMGKLVGGHPLHQRSGRLSRSIHHSVDETKLDAKVSTNVVYARIHEYGGTVDIKEHMRTMRQAFGRPVKNPRQISVRAHQAHYPERSFLRSALAESRALIHREITRGVNEAIHES